MDYIQIKNLRSLYDTDEIEIKKINMLVGNNSSGKSTFLRIFPLLKQSFNKRINGPILWAGDEDDYVDFGSFREALSNGSNEDMIRFKFKFFCKFDFNVIFSTSNGGRIIPNREEGTVAVEFAISHNEQSTYDYISELILEYRNYKTTINFSSKNEILALTVNDEKIDVIREDTDYFTFAFESGIFNISLYSIRATARKRFLELANISDKENFIIQYFYATRMCTKPKKLGESKESDKAEEILKGMQNQQDELRKWVFLYYLPNYYMIISDYIREYFNNVYYIAPVRATAARYYRLRNVAVNEVDCRGKNLPVFLNSLRTEQFHNFQKWTKRHLGFEVEKSLSEGHVSLKIKKDGQDKAVNLSDTGFGYSQILPIVTQLWYITEAENKRGNAMTDRRNKFKLPITIAIEQPELHLHPALQAKLMDIIAKIAMEKDVRFVIETHSETIINRIGLLIDKGKVNNKDIEITIFDKKFGDSKTQVLKSTFDEEGYLKDWPIGFFEPEED